MSQKRTPTSVVRLMTRETQWEEFEWEAVGEDLIARHVMKVNGGAGLEGCLRAMHAVKHGLVEVRVTARVGRPPEDLRAHRVATPEELAEMREAA